MVEVGRLFAQRKANVNIPVALVKVLNRLKFADLERRQTGSQHRYFSGGK